MGWIVKGAQTRGARDYQEDDFRIDEQSSTANVINVVLADGMGGHAAGALAARLAVEAGMRELSALAEHDRALSAEELRQVVSSANKSVGAHASSDPSAHGMGCTFIGVRLRGESMQWVSVGDSPLWVAGPEGLRQVNADHSFGAKLDRLARAGEITQEQAQRDPRRNSLMSAITGEPLTDIDIRVNPLTIAADERVVAASDGVQFLPDEVVLKLARSGHLSDAVDNMIAEIDKRKMAHQDNATVVLIERRSAENNAGNAETVYGGRAIADALKTNMRAGSATQLASATKRKGDIFFFGALAIVLLLAVAILAVWFLGPNAPGAPRPGSGPATETAAPSPTAGPADAAAAPPSSAPDISEGAKATEKALREIQLPESLQTEGDAPEQTPPPAQSPQ